MTKKYSALILCFMFIFVCNANAGYFAKKEIETGRYVKRCLRASAPIPEEGYVWEEIQSPTDVEIYQPPLPLSFNAKRFLASLLSDENFVNMAYEDYFPSVGFCLQNGNFEALTALMGKLVSDGKVTMDTVNAFKAKLMEEEGVSL